MECERWREAISAEIDGEQSPIESTLVVAHLARCPECRVFRDVADDSRRRSRVTIADEMPDLAPRIVRLRSVMTGSATWSVVRIALAVVTVVVVALGLRGLTAGGERAEIHGDRHLAAFSLAYGAALAVVVLRPARARAVLPVTIVLAGMLLVTGLVDVVDGHVPLIGEAQHVPELISVLLVWLLAVPALGRRTSSNTAPRSLRAVARGPDEGGDGTRSRAG